MEHGVKISGLLGVLISAKQQSLISEIKPLIDLLQNDIGFRLNPKLYIEILKIVDEE